MEINGKIYRNLEGQVGYLTEKWDDLQDQINDVKAHLVHYIIVEELPTEDIDASAVYLVGPKGTAPDTYYEEWVYVQVEGQTDMWEKLGDTASVDLSSYLQKDTSITTYAKAYIKKADGTQDTVSMSSTPNQGFVVQWGSGGRVATKDPVNSSDAVNLSYANSNYVIRRTDVTANPIVYAKAADGSVDSFGLSTVPTAYYLVQRKADSQISVPYTPLSATDATSKDYVDSTFLAKQTGTSSYVNVYAKATDGSQVMLNVNGNPISDSIPFRFAYGHIKLPNQLTYPPTDDDYAVSKRYVDAAVGQLLYLHDIDLTITVDATNKLYVKAYLINGSPTAITSFDRIVYKRLDVQWGGFGPSSDHAVPSAVTKMPDNFRQDDFEEPLVGFLYQYFSGGNLVSAHTNSIMSTTISDVVTTW